MDDDKTQWNKIFALRPETLLPPESFLVRNLNHLKTGTVLDVACGDGRNSIFLARNKFEVTGVDSSSEALRRLQQFSAEMGLKVRTGEFDLEALQSLMSLKKMGTFDNIIVNHYKPGADFWKLAPELLNPQGTLVVCTFNMGQHRLENFPEQYCLAPYELVGLQGFMMIHHEVFQEEDRNLDGYIFKKV